MRDDKNQDGLQVRIAAQKIANPETMTTHQVSYLSYFSEASKIPAVKLARANLLAKVAGKLFVPEVKIPADAGKNLPK